MPLGLREMQVYSRESAAQVLGVSLESIDLNRKKGKLSYRKVGRRILFTEKDLSSFLESCAVPAFTMSVKQEAFNENPS